MNRRNVLQSAASFTAGATLLSARTAKTGAESPKAPTPPFLETSDGARLYLKSWGAGKPVVFVHSWAMNSDMWQYQMIHLAAQGMRCIAFDRRGHGRSTDPGRDYDLDTLAADLAAVIDRLDLRDATLVGHSMGCGEIVRYLSRHGAKRVSRAVLVAPTTPFLLKTDTNPDGIDPALLDQTRAAWTSDFPKWLADNARPFVLPETSPQTLQWAIDMILQCSLQAAIDFSRASAATDFRSEMRQLTLPVLIVHGDRDVSAPLELCGRRSAQLIPGSRLIVYQGAPHGLFMTHIDRLNRDLLAFITA